jgi:hypothetical protein
MDQTLSYFPGQQVTIFLDMKDGYSFADGYFIPQVNRIVYPNLSLATGYPQAMTRFDTGIYYAYFTLPTGATAVGSYFVDVMYDDPVTTLITHRTYQIVVTAPFGNFGTTTG